MALLECHDLSVAYGGVHALMPTTFSVDIGQLVGLIGPNGAGKTTLIDALTGATSCQGRVIFDGHDISTFKPHRRASMGLGRTFQGMELFDDISVQENLLVAADRTRWWTALVDAVHPPRRRSSREVARALEVAEISQYADVLPSELPNGVRKRVAVGRALASNPKLLLLDEPAAGLDSEESVALGRRLRGLVDDGLPLLLVDHDMGLVLSVCDYIYVLNFGEVIAEGPPDVVRRDDNVIDAYLGGATAP
jgi:ABC-type branched-subunit amino acid transport system ATPase component